MKSIEERLTDIERRLAALEGQADEINLSAAETPSAPPAAEPDSPLIALRVSNKRYAPSNPSAGSYEDHIWFDCTYTLRASSRPTRAVKGLLEFADLFGDVQFRLNVTLNDPLLPDLARDQPGIGFSYNQFMTEHQWMMVTNLTDMKVSFRPMNVIYADGTSESFS